MQKSEYVLRLRLDKVEADVARLRTEVESTLAVAGTVLETAKGMMRDHERLVAVIQTVQKDVNDLILVSAAAVAMKKERDEDASIRDASSGMSKAM